MKTHKFSLKKEYAQSWNFIKESKKFIYATIGIFLIFALAGFFIPTPDILKSELLKLIQELVGQIGGLSQFGIIKFIFFNNVQSSFFGMILGIFFGIFPVIAVIVNGYLLGFVASMAVSADGIGSLWRIFPHGIFELPAVFISLGLGIKLGTLLIQKSKKNSFKDYFLNCIKVFVLIIIPLLIIAAIIEGSLIFLAK